FPSRRSSDLKNTFSPEDDTDFESIKDKDLRVIAIVEEWCGHCMLNVPLLLHIVEKTNMPVRFLPRDENLELMDQYLTNGNRVIPIFIFIDHDGYEVAKWGPMAPETREFVNEHRKDLPEKDAADYDEKFKQFIKTVGNALRSDEKIWQNSYKDIKQTIA